jgi:hypothetical protein
MTRTAGIILAALGIVVAAAGWVLWGPALDLGHKKALAAVILGALVLVIGLYGTMRPSAI